MSRRGENIYKRKDGRWEGRYRIGQDETGKTRYRSVYAHSYQEVKEQLQKLKSAPQMFRPSGKLTVKMLFEEWMRAIKLKVKDSTYANYRMKADKHLLPKFGHIRYEDLSVQQLHSFIQEKLSSGLSAKYVSDIVVVFKSMTKYISRIYGFRNPIAETIMPKLQKREMKLYSEAQQKHLCGHLLRNLNRTALGILLSLYTGLRIGEVCALRCSDVDMERRQLTIRRTVQRIRNENGGTRLMVGSPKSQTSRRTIPIPDFLMQILYRFMGNGDDYVLTGNRRLIEPRTMQYRFKSILKKANLPSSNYHSLRHLFATNCIKAGFDVKTLSELLGHAAVETTLNRYVHSSMERKIACMNLLQLAS